MVSRSGRYAVSVLVACVLLAGCQPANTPLPAPTPSLRCTPEAGGAEYDCTPYEYDDMVAKDKLYAEAEAVYRRYLAEDLRITGSGGVEAPTGELLETTSGAFLTQAMEGYRRDKAGKITIRGGDRIVESLTRLIGVSKAGSTIAVRACLNASSIKVYKAGKYSGHGLITQDDLYFARIDSRLKLIGADGKEVDSCASG